MVNGGMDISTANMVSEPPEGSENSNSYLRAIIDSLEDELLVVDKDYRVVQANEAVLRRHGGGGTSWRRSQCWTGYLKYHRCSSLLSSAG